MWRDTRMIMLTAVVAAVYAAVLIPFKGLTIIPGITSVRPANVFPVIFSLMFGPAAAWGSAIGNLIGDIFGGTLGPGSAFGFLGNFFFGFVGYKLWGNLGALSSGAEPDFRTNAGKQLVEYAVVTVVAATVTAGIIAWGLEVLGLFPFSVLGTIITINNFIAAIVLGPPLLYLTYPRVKEMGLLYPDVLRASDLSNVGTRRRQTAAYVIIGVSVAWVVVGIAISVGLGGIPFLAAPGVDVAPGTGGSTVQIALGAVALLILLGASVISGEHLSDLVGSPGTSGSRRPW
jgi:energy-coupling factor transport system substrate-specific component